MSPSTLTPPYSSAANRARSACDRCHRGKRRCDRALPACELCTKKQLSCRYPKPLLSPPRSFAADDLETMTPLAERYPSSDLSSEAHAPDQALLASRGIVKTLTAVQFLAPRIFYSAELEIPALQVPVPGYAAPYVETTQQIRDIASEYFAIAPMFLPILCRRQFLSAALNPFSPRRSEYLLLAICVKLYCTSRPEAVSLASETAALYRCAKRFHAELEAAGALSLRILQAGIFIALYEIGQAIFPAAYLTVGACARYGTALGLDKLMDNNNISGKLDGSWLAIEESRRVSWAILIMDRFLSLGNPSRPLATVEPNFNYYLPVDDKAFLDGGATPQPAVPISAGFNLNMGSFARLAQASFLSSQAIQYLSRPEPPLQTNGIARIGENTAQLRRTLAAQVHAAEEEQEVRKLPTCCQAMFSYCAVLLLQEHEWQAAGITSTEEAYQHMFEETTRCLDFFGRAVVAVLGELKSGGCLECYPLFFIQTLYQAAGVTMDLAQGNHDPTLEENLAIFRSALQHFQPRWQLADVFLNILDTKESIIMASA